MTGFELTDQDRRILALLQRDGRISNQDLAERTAMSTSACWRRVKALEEAGIIARYVALVDARRAGMAFHAIVLVKLSRHSRDHVVNFIAEVQRREEVLDCFATTGESDYHLRVLCPDLDAYNDFLDNFLFGLPGVANVHTNMVLKQIKHETAVSFG
ncbi:Lrp/AsnC family transcriptional regulator [Acidimangrovimonas pyrenivorans]|uniref:Lrp/AsnC family transcriptional regulator n=1 Tax=Acidimangrovimonas pyrenivorans TaxID=2030798 RepID=A0ABV7AJ56_9RHOB